jgi:nucleolar protein 15
MFLLTSKWLLTSMFFLVCRHIPYGFYEKQMKEYFSQFGKVTKIRLSRNKKTGKSKHYAFVQFQSSDVAKIVADAMNGYMFFGQKLETRTLMKKEIHPELFKGANRVFKRIPWKKIEIERHNKVRSEEEIQNQAKRVSRRNSLRAKCILEVRSRLALGINAPLMYYCHTAGPLSFFVNFSMDRLG